MGRSRYRFVEPDQPHFMTFTVAQWLPVFTRPETVEVLLDSLRFLSAEGLRVYAYVILENHMHLIAQSASLNRDIARFRSFTAKRILALLEDLQARTLLDQLSFFRKAHKTDREFQFWQESVHPELIQVLPMMQQKVEYIHNNPVARGYVDEPTHWRYSSARDYDGQKGLLEVYRDWR